jgi:rare lipoprotein A
LLASCAAAPTSRTKEHFSEAEYGVPASPRLVAHGRPVPKGGGRYLVGNPYRVAGKTYVPRDNPGYSAVGLASWYGSSFHGRKTANGEVYDMNDLTAAHPTLPLPSYARVTNLSNGRSVVVRVNDRGPFKSKRIIDVSSTVAAVLDFKRAGVARVKVDYVGPARMDGLDRNMLLASYRAPGRPASGTMIASNAAPSGGLVLASAPLPRMKTSGGVGEPIAPVPIPAALTLEDPLAPLILRTGFASSYLPTDHFTKAQEAAAGLAAAGSRAAARSSGAATTVQIGAFADPSNAMRVGTRFSKYGKVAFADQMAGERSVRVVRVVVVGNAAVKAVIEAAGAAGLSGAFVLAH